jgi:hypothetical protein
MKGKRGPVCRWLGSRLQLLAMVSLVLASVAGQPIESSAGLLACPLTAIELAAPVKKRKRRSLGSGVMPASLWICARTAWESLCRTGARMLIQSAFVCVLWELSGEVLPVWVLIVPCMRWLLEGASWGWPRLGRQPELRWMRWGVSWLHCGSVLALGAAVVYQRLCQDLFSCSFLDVAPWGLTGRCVVEEKGRESASPIEVVSVEGGYRIQLQGPLSFQVNQDEPFRLRLAILFLRQLEGEEQHPVGRATRDGRRPLICQQQLASWFGVTQPEISRWEKSWLAGNWANLLSLRCAEVLTRELRERIVDVVARFPWWGQERVYTHLRDQGVEVTQSQVGQASRESGWSRLRETMNRFFVVSCDSIRPRDEGLVRELLAQVKMLVHKLEMGEGLTPEERLDVEHLNAVCEEVGLGPHPEAAGAPWARKMKWILFGSNTTADQEGEKRCTYCGSTDVKLKGRKPRRKRWLDETGEQQTVEVYRYRCCNPQCAYGSFTLMPLGLLPHSPYPLRMRLAALEMYAWMESTYRRTAQALGVKSGRVYRWVSAFGEELLPMAALFGVVRSSGVVGIDEKWVQVPEKAPRGSGRSKHPGTRRWMYVYLAVDVHTYDLLHIAIYAHNTADSTRAFLLALRAKGYNPRVIVTDLRQEYGPAIAEVFDKATHHECIFHALQWISRQLKDIYGSDYTRTYPEAAALREKIIAIFRAQTKRTAEKRYAHVMELRQQHLNQNPDAASIFNTLERHWPKLVNAIESAIIPRTNNAVELVIRRFDHHYQNFCGFDSIESARLFLGVFEKVYRFTPFTDDAQPRIRGKCPLELAGYDISSLPMAQVCRGWALDWPLDHAEEVVPNA